MQRLVILWSSPLAFPATLSARGEWLSYLVLPWLFDFFNLPVKFLACLSAAAPQQWDHTALANRTVFFVPCFHLFPTLLAFLTTTWLRGEVWLSGSRDAGFHCQLHPGTLSCKLSIGREWEQPQAIFLSIVQQFLLKMLLNLFLFSFWSLEFFFFFFFTILSRLVVVSYRDELPVSSLYYRQKFSQMYFNVPNLKENEFTDLLILSSKPHVGCLFVLRDSLVNLWNKTSG